MSGMRPIDVVTSIIPGLSDKERDEVKELLGKQSICDRQGHKYKKVATIPSKWFFPEKAKMTCERCGHTITQ